MDKLIQQAVKNLKNNNEESLKQVLINFLSKYTDTPYQYYSDETLEDIAIRIFCGYMAESNYVLADLLNFFAIYKRVKDLTKAICITLSLVQVKEDQNNYVSGFTKEGYENE